MSCNLLSFPYKGSHFFVVFVLSKNWIRSRGRNNTVYVKKKRASQCPQHRYLCMRQSKNWRCRLNTTRKSYRGVLTFAKADLDSKQPYQKSLYMCFTMTWPRRWPEILPPRGPPLSVFSKSFSRINPNVLGILLTVHTDK